MLYCRYPDAASMEMESFVLLHLAKCSRIPVFATAASIVVANRCTADVVPGDLLEDMEVRVLLCSLAAKSLLIRCDEYGVCRYAVARPCCRRSLHSRCN